MARRLHAKRRESRFFKCLVQKLLKIVFCRVVHYATSVEPSLDKNRNNFARVQFTKLAKHPVTTRNPSSMLGDIISTCLTWSGARQA